MSVFLRAVPNDADKALNVIAAAEHGLTRNELRDRLQRNWRSRRIDDALAVLLGADLIITTEEPTRGRSATRYIAAQYADDLNDLAGEELPDGSLDDALKARTCLCGAHALPVRDLDGVVRCHRCGYEVEDDTINVLAVAIEGPSR